MRINTNTWNKIRYTLYTPVYDLIAAYFKDSRKKSVESLEIKPGDKVLIVGAGTGLDLEFLPGGCKIIAIDITPSMVDRVKKRGNRLNLDVQAMIMDGQSLKFAANSFDFVILHLILAVIPDPVACINEAGRVLKDAGQVIVFDKFVRSGERVSLIRRYANVLTNFLGTDITRDFEAIARTSGLTVVSDVEADLKGIFRLIKLEKQ